MFEFIYILLQNGSLKLHIFYSGTNKMSHAIFSAIFGYLTLLLLYAEHLEKR